MAHDLIRYAEAGRTLEIFAEWLATPDANIGMGGPAMIEGGGLGVFVPEDVGPVSVQVPNGVIDVLVDDEKEAVDVARRYLSYFHGPVDEHAAPDQTLLRTLVPEQRKRAYPVRHAIETLCDEGSVMELRDGFGGEGVPVAHGNDDAGVVTTEFWVDDVYFFQ